MINKNDYKVGQYIHIKYKTTPCIYTVLITGLHNGGIIGNFKTGKITNLSGFLDNCYSGGLWPWDSIEFIEIIHEANMLSAKIVKREVEKVVKTIEERVNLELSKEDAVFLNTVLGCINTNGFDENDVVQKIYDNLTSIGCDSLHQFDSVVLKG